MPPMRRTNIRRRKRNARNINEFRRAHNTQARGAQTPPQIRQPVKKKKMAALSIDTAHSSQNTSDSEMNYAGEKDIKIQKNIEKCKRHRDKIRTSHLFTSTSDIGDMCISRCHCSDNQFIIMVAVYISPNNSLRDIRDFFYENLFIYSYGASALLHQKIGKRFDDLPMILSGDFNINFADDKNLPLLKFFKNVFGLNMSNDRNLSTARYKTTIDAVFTRYLNKFESKLFVSYFSYHKPIVSVLEICGDAGSDDGARVGKMMDGN